MATEVQTNPNPNPLVPTSPTNQTTPTKIIPTTTATINKTHNHITNLPTFAARGEAIAKRLEAVKADPKYLALPEDHKAKVRADIYKKYVPASYRGFHLPIPDKDTWVAATGRDTNHIMDGKKLSDTYGFQGHSSNFWRHNQEENQDLGAGFQKGVANIKMFGAKLANRAFLTTFGLAEHFAKNDTQRAEISKEFAKYETPKVLNNYIQAQKAKVQDADFWLQTHPRDTVIGRLDGMAGEQLATLPLYEAVSFEKLGATIGVPLTAKLIKSPVGRWTATRLIQGSEAFMASLVASGGNKNEAKKSGVGAVVLGAAGEYAGNKIASSPLIKKWMANIIAMGGKPFSEELVHSAAAEEEQLIAHADKYGTPSTGEGLAQVKRTVQIQNFRKEVQEGASSERAQAIRDWYAEQQLRSIEDPVNHKLHEAQKVALNSTAFQLFNDGFHNLGPIQRQLVVGKQLSLVGEAAREAIVHLPDLHKSEVEEGIKTLAASNTPASQLMQTLQKQGVEFVEAVAENNTTAVAKETGISNVRAALNKVSKGVKEVAKEKGEPIDTARFVSLNADSKAYLRAPRNRAVFNAAMSDRSKAGANAFINELSKANPGQMHFEDPAQLMLFHYGNRKDLAPNIVSSIRYRLKQLKGYENLNLKQLDLTARQLHAHIYDMAKSGLLRTEGNIFRSTKLGGPVSFTPWQNQLSDKSVQKEIVKTTKALAQHPSAAKTYQTLIKVLNKNWITAKTPEEYIAFKDTLFDTGKTLRSTVKNFANVFDQ